jgi:C1A family cysteine protease
VFNCIPSRNRELDWTVESASRARLHPDKPVPPASVDLRRRWWTVSDQGDTGSCVGWASVDGLLRWHFVSTRRIRQADRLSPRFAWMAAKETDEFTARPTTFIEGEGTSLKAALEVAREYGAVHDAVLPFDGRQLFSGGTDEFFARAAQLRISAYFTVAFSEWRNWLAHNGPLLVRLDVDDAWMDATSTGGVLKRYKKPDRPAGHAVVIAGYTRNHFIVRNSWGTGWGDAGFAYASNAYAAAAFAESYGIT